MYLMKTRKLRKVTVMQSEREFMCEFIELYRSFPCLWNRSSREYSDRKMKTKAYDVLVQKLQTRDPQSNRQSVVKKINSLRTAYRKEQRKVMCSKTSGTGEKDVHVPRLYYYELLHFIKDHDISRQRKTNVESSQIAGDDATMSDAPNSPRNDDTSSPASPSSSASSTSTSAKPVWRSTKPAPKSRKTKHKYDELLYLLGNRLAQPPADKFTNIAAAWAFKLKELAPLQAHHAEKLISDVFYEAQLGNLRHGCSLQIPPAQPPHLNHSSVPSAMESIEYQLSPGGALNGVEKFDNASV